MTSLYESDVEKFAIELLEKQGYAYLSPEEQALERSNHSEVVLRNHLKAAIDNLNPELPDGVKEQALLQATALSPHNLVESNEAFYKMLAEGVAEEYQKDGETVGARVCLMDFENPLNNNFVVCNQFSVTENQKTRRLDIVLFINGMPLVVMELKNPTDEKATIGKAFDQLQTYKDIIPSLFCYNGVLLASDGCDAKAGALTSPLSRFMQWKTVDGKKEDPKTTPQLETVIKGMLRPDVLVDLIGHFTVFERAQKKNPETDLTHITKEKKIAAYHQYHAVKEAVKSTIRASHREKDTKAKEEPGAYGLPSVKNQPKGDRKAGVVWHTQGSGKSLSMVFYAGLLVVNREMKNPTIVVITDRNDLDDQLFDAFVAGKNLLRQSPAQAKSRDHLKELLKTASGGVVFSTIQKFSPDGDNEIFELLSNRKNIIVIADEAHRSQYGFKAKTFFMKDGVKTKYGFAKYLRDALPEASFIGFTGTPIEKEDISTPAVFGNYIDVYDIEQAVEDKATVPIYYESRLVKVHLKEEEKGKLDAKIEEITENEESTATEKAKAKWAKQEAIIGHKDRRKTVVADILEHFEKKQEVFESKAMIVATSRRIAVAMYDDIIAKHPDWHDDDKNKGVVKVVMTSSSSDPAAWQKHATTKQERKTLGERFKDPEDPLQLVIVRDMWLTGFDAPCLGIIYVDKLMRGHNLMQAIARVNRIYNDKPSGLVVDYIGIASDLKHALTSYTKSGGKGTPVFEQEKAVEKMLENHDVVADMFDKFDYKRYFSADTREKLTLIIEAMEYILGLENGKERFTKQVALLSKAFALAVPDPRAMHIKAEVGFFQAIKTRLAKLESNREGKSNAEIETVIKQIVDKAVVVGGVIDIFDATGIKKPDISILSDDFLEEVKGMKHKNIALELLKKILNDEIKVRTKKNFVQSKKFSEMLQKAIIKYNNNLLSTTQVIEELILLAKEIKLSDQRTADMGLSDDEVAFYDALAMNQSAKTVMGDSTLKKLAQILVKNVKSNTSIDWTIRESVRAKLRSDVKRILNKYGYPPDEQKIAADRILQQAELLADEWASA